MDKNLKSQQYSGRIPKIIIGIALLNTVYFINYKIVSNTKATQYFSSFQVPDQQPWMQDP